MAKERTREDVESELWWEKKQKKLLLICTAIFAGIGIIIGLVLGISEGDTGTIFAGFFGGLWIGTGVGGAISYLPEIPHMFKQSVKEGGGCFGEGCFDSVKDLLLGILVWMGIFYGSRTHWSAYTIFDK